ncbi:MAG: S-layer homology domain-containing protein [Leptolyngbyaceae cyanobacterium]
MVDLPPPNPNNRPSPSPLRDNDEAIAVAIAFLSIGAILWWGWTRGQQFFSPPVDLSKLPASVAGSESSLGLDDITGEADTTSDQDGLFSFFRREAVDKTDAAKDTPSTASQADTATSGLMGGMGGLSSNNRDRRVDAEASRAAVATPGSTDATEGAAAPSAIAPEAAAPDDNATAPSEAEPEGSAQSLPELDISDVSEDYWAYPYIVSLYEQDLLPDFPSGQLQPDKELTRAEFAALLNSSFVKDEQTKRELGFSDVTSDFWAADAIKKVVDTGYMSGFPEGTFQPDQVVPRYQVFITMATGLELSPPTDVEGALNRFPGAQDLPGWARPQVAAAASEGLIINHPDPQQLAPQQPATRGEIIAIIHQALATQGRIEPIESEFVAPPQ